MNTLKTLIPRKSQKPLKLTCIVTETMQNTQREGGGGKLPSRGPSVKEACLSCALAQLRLARTHDRIEIEIDLPIPGGADKPDLLPLNLRYNT